MDKRVMTVVLGVLMLVALIVFVASVDPNLEGHFTKDPSCHAKMSSGSWQYCTVECPCDVGYGDCDTNLDCRAGLKCADNWGEKFGFGTWVDVCVKYKDYVEQQERLIK
jgi:hypothetical protein